MLVSEAARNNKLWSWENIGMAKELSFATGDYVVYPSHGVGQITGVRMEDIAGHRLEMYVVSFEHERLTLRVPVARAANSGMRKLSSRDKIQSALNALKAKPRPRRAVMWSRRAQEYEAKINSGDLIAIAEVVRDLFRSDTQPEQSYSERQLYEAALDRMSREISSVSKISETEAIRQIEQNLAKSPRRGVPREGEAKDAKAA